MNGPQSAYKLFIRLDASNRPIDSTNKLQKTRPKQGNWIEVKDVHANVCCDQPITLTFEITSLAPNPILTLTADEGNTMTLYSSNATTPATNQELVDILQSQFGYLGVFSVVGDTLTLKLIKSTAILLSPSLDIAMNLAFD